MSLVAIAQFLKSLLFVLPSKSTDLLKWLSAESTIEQSSPLNRTTGKRSGNYLVDLEHKWGNLMSPSLPHQDCWGCLADAPLSKRDKECSQTLWPWCPSICLANGHADQRLTRRNAGGDEVDEGRAQCVSVTRDFTSLLEIIDEINPKALSNPTSPVAWTESETAIHGGQACFALLLIYFLLLFFILLSQIGYLLRFSEFFLSAQ